MFAFLSQNHRSIVAFSVRPLEDMNEITSHMLEVVQAHMVLCKPQTMVRTFNKQITQQMLLSMVEQKVRKSG